MSGGGGTTTTYSNNTPYNSSQLLDVQNGAVTARYNNPLSYTPYSTYAAPTDNTWANLSNAQSDYGNAGNQNGSLVANAQNDSINTNKGVAGGTSAWNTSLAGLGAYNPSYQDIDYLRWGNGTNALNDTATGKSAGSGLLYQSAVGNGPGGGQLTDTASGKYLGSNPTLDATYKAASDPVVSAYQTATSPNTDSAFAAAGRYNSGASSNATLNNETALGKSLADLSADIYGTDYENERGRQVTAANDIGNQSITAANNWGNLSNNAAIGANTAYGNAGTLNVTGTNAQSSALNSALTNQQAAVNATPAQTGMPYTDYKNAYTAGTATQDLNQKALDDVNYRYYGTEYSPWETLKQEGNLIGPAINGSGTSTYPTSTNTTGQILGGLGSAASIGTSAAALAAK